MWKPTHPYSGKGASQDTWKLLNDAGVPDSWLLPSHPSGKGLCLRCTRETSQCRLSRGRAWDEKWEWARKTWEKENGSAPSSRASFSQTPRHAFRCADSHFWEWEVVVSKERWPGRKLGRLRLGLLYPVANFMGHSRFCVINATFICYG